MGRGGGVPLLFSVSFSGSAPSNSRPTVDHSRVATTVLIVGGSPRLPADPPAGGCYSRTEGLRSRRRGGGGRRRGRARASATRSAADRVASRVVVLPVEPVAEETSALDSSSPPPRSRSRSRSRVPQAERSVRPPVPGGAGRAGLPPPGSLSGLLAHQAQVDNLTTHDAARSRPRRGRAGRISAPVLSRGRAARRTGWGCSWSLRASALLAPSAPLQRRRVRVHDSSCSASSATPSSPTRRWRIRRARHRPRRASLVRVGYAAALNFRSPCSSSTTAAPPSQFDPTRARALRGSGTRAAVERIQKAFVIFFFGVLATLFIVLIARRLARATPRSRRMLAPLCSPPSLSPCGRSSRSSSPSSTPRSRSTTSSGGRSAGSSRCRSRSSPVSSAPASPGQRRRPRRRARADAAARPAGRPRAGARRSVARGRVLASRRGGSSSTGRSAPIAAPRGRRRASGHAAGA